MLNISLDTNDGEGNLTVSIKSEREWVTRKYLGDGGNLGYFSRILWWFLFRLYYGRENPLCKITSFCLLSFVKIFSICSFTHQCLTWLNLLPSFVSRTCSYRPMDLVGPVSLFVLRKSHSPSTTSPFLEVRFSNYTRFRASSLPRGHEIPVHVLPVLIVPCRLSPFSTLPSPPKSV